MHKVSRVRPYGPEIIVPRSMTWVFVTVLLLSNIVIMYPFYLNANAFHKLLRFLLKCKVDLSPSLEYRSTSEHDLGLPGGCLKTQKFTVYQPFFLSITTFHMILELLSKLQCLLASSTKITQHYRTSLSYFIIIFITVMAFSYTEKLTVYCFFFEH